MKKVITLFLFFPLLLIGQNQPPPTAQGVFDINGVKTSVGPGAMFWNLDDARYEVPQGLGRHSIFAHEYWLGGVDDGGQLRVAAQTYKQGGIDLWSGPCSDSTVHDSTFNVIWNRVWKINKTQIDSHMLFFTSPNYIIPEAINTWPAHGDTTIGQSYYLAPFIDIDNNGIYNPSLGDYPEIKGDQAIYFIRNDIGNIHTETGGLPMGIEQHLMFYGYKCNDKPSIENTLFVNMKIFNRGSSVLNDFYAGTWLDPDLGYYLDDYVGCDVARNLGYAYNGDIYDEGVKGYSIALCNQNSAPPPAQGLVYLGVSSLPNSNDTMAKFLYYNNDFSVTGNPSSPQHFYNYLRGVWKDGVPMTYGGDGHGSGPGATTDPCDYMFPSDTDPDFPFMNWTEASSGNVPADRRFLMSAGPINLDIDSVYTLDYALVFAWDTVTNSNLGSLNLLKTYTDEVKLIYSNPSLLVCNTLGCVDSIAVNFNPLATLDDGSCCYLGGCIDVLAYNYDPSALCDDGSCDYLGVPLKRIAGIGNGGIFLEINYDNIDSLFISPEHRIINPVYEISNGPVNITVVDTVNALAGEYSFELKNPVFNGNSISTYGGWIISDSSGNIIDSSNTLIDFHPNGSYNIPNFHVSQLGIYITIKQEYNAGEIPWESNYCSDLVGLSQPAQNGFIGASIEYTNTNDQWLSAVPDRDDEVINENHTFWALNWIRSGSYTDDNNAYFSDYNQSEDPFDVYESVLPTSYFDSSLSLSNYSGGTWAPYRFVSYYEDGPGWTNSVTSQNKLEKLNSVDIVFTSDTSKWTRCVVVEAQEDITKSIGGALKMGLRESPSVNKLGLNDGSGRNGMGWFPGYAYDVVTGERLNIIFAEDSWLTNDNGNDMLWNPSSNVIDSMPYYNPLTQETESSFSLGGKHFIYIINGESWVKGTDDYVNGNYFDVDNSPNYDGGEWIYQQLFNDSTGVGKWKVFKNTSWVNIPLLSPGKNLLSNDVKIKLRVNKPYKQYETVDADKILSPNDTLEIGKEYVVAYENSAITWGGKVINHNGNSFSPGDVFQASTTNFTGSSKSRVVRYNGQNLFNPKYSFTIGNNFVNANLGCTDSTAINYDSLATVDDGSCVYPLLGCTDPTALNYDSLANVDDGSCLFYTCQEPAPTNVYSSNITDIRATINWDNMNSSDCKVLKYVIRFKEFGTFSWTTKSGGAGNGLCNFGLNNTSKNLNNLTPSTTYEYKIKAFYCNGGSSVWSLPKYFTTSGPCPEMINLSTLTYPSNTGKVTFSWDTTGSYVFARIALRVNNTGSTWQTAGGFGVYYPTLFVNKFGLLSGTDYRAQGRTFCDSNITSYRSWWTPPIFWTQPGTIRTSGGKSIKNLDIFPNPSRDVFNITFTSDKQQDLRIRILSVIGAELYKEDRDNFIGEYTKQVRLDNYGKGIYFLEIETNTGIVNKKLILQ